MTALFIGRRSSRIKSHRADGDQRGRAVDDAVIVKIDLGSRVLFFAIPRVGDVINTRLLGDTNEDISLAVNRERLLLPLDAHNAIPIGDGFCQIIKGGGVVA